MKNLHLMIVFLILSLCLLGLYMKSNDVLHQTIIGLLSKACMIIAIFICSKELFWKKSKL